MKCEKCGSDCWSDDDLHWQWCKNPKCLNSYGGNEQRMRDFFQEIEEKQQRNEELYGDEPDITWFR